MVNKQVLTLANISRIKDKQTTEFGHLIEQNRKIYFFKNHAENEAGTHVADLFLFLKKSLLDLKASDQQFHFNIIWWPSSCMKLYDLLNFNFLEKGLGIVFPTHFENYFSRKNFLVLYSINWPNFIISLPLFIEILANICIANVC